MNLIYTTDEVEARKIRNSNLNLGRKLLDIEVLKMY